MDFSDESRSVNPGGMRDSMTGQWKLNISLFATYDDTIGNV